MLLHVYCLVQVQVCKSQSQWIHSSFDVRQHYLSLLELRSKNLSVQLSTCSMQTISDPEMCRFGGIDALPRWYYSNLRKSPYLYTLSSGMGTLYIKFADEPSEALTRVSDAHARNRGQLEPFCEQLSDSGTAMPNDTFEINFTLYTWCN